VHKKHMLTCVDVVCTVHVMSDVISSSLLSMRPHVVGSCRMLMLSVMPPVRSARPSSSVPYFSASYDPCNLHTDIRAFNLQVATTTEPAQLVSSN
jgi:hypothetical protein